MTVIAAHRCELKRGAIRKTMKNKPSSKGQRRHRGRSLQSGPDALRPYIGQWVATAGGVVLVAAETPAEVVGWLAEHGLTAESMFRVPENEQAAGGGAPL